ncbi:outer membrane receptor protein involved in Fe transport [Janthinobacterium sp. 61]|uniref:TonB-dependent receptor family protein n=1 Tax=Janthinobacterium sp. 61 TaxID=2035209 RepID=UPI000CC9B06C|nr:TonB-dependent receptor [Janthinobacterium sp. 61]PKV47510.1 outer membrane receptor protein involved in Fe transport [Janthinobacterium sp. 61]
MNKKLLVLAMAITLAYPCAQAQSDHAIDTVVVSGSRAQSWLSETPQAIGVVNAAVLERDKPKTMGDILNRIAGVYWNDLGNEQHSMSIRQPIGTNAVYQYLEDGIPIRPLGVFNHNSLNEMNMAGASGVEVVKGAASSLYGSNAVGGAVNFLTAGASATPTAKVGVRRDNVGGFTRYDTSASDTWGPLGLRFSHYSSRRSRDNWQEYSYGDKDSFSLRADYALSPTSQLRATIVHTDLDAAMTGSLFEDDYRNAPGKSLNTFTYRKDKTTRMNLAWEGETTAHGTSTVTVFTRKNDHGQIPAYSIGSCAGMLCKGVINNNHVDSLGLDLKHQQEFTWLRSRLVAGVYVDKSDNPFVSDNLSIVRDTATGRYLRYTLANASNPQGVRDYQTDILNTALFAQWEFSPLAGTRVVLGGRSDAIRYDYHNKLAPGGSVNYGAPDESRSFSHLSPKLGATYAIGQAGSAYANVSQGFTPPEVSQLYGKTGIADLQPSVYNNYELGLRWAFLQGRLKLDAALYRLDGRDTIVSYTLSPGNSENRNAGRTRSEGLELGLNYDSGPFDVRFATAISRHRYLRYQVSASLDYSGRTMPQAPRDITSFEIGYKPVAGARLALEAVHQGRYWMNNANTVEYKGHALLNLRASYQLARGLEAWAQVRNLADKRYADSASSSYAGTGSYVANTQNQYTPGAPRSVMLGLGYTFNAL